jgi:hypothetical protein
MRPREVRRRGFNTAIAGAAFAIAITVAPSIARADDTTAARSAAAARDMGRPYTMAEVGAGFLGLPAAEVCTRTINKASCSQGEASLSLGIHFLYRDREWAFGAGIDWATTLRTDAARGAASLERQHTRSYFLVEAQGRYYPLRRGPWEYWVGATLGGVVVNDSFSEKADRSPPSDVDIQGPRAATIGTEGLAAGIATGAEYIFWRNWSLGADFRYANWFLPTGRQILPTGDVASLSGRVDVFELGVLLAYRIAL